MSRIYSRTEIVTVVTRLTEERLNRFIAAEALEPQAEDAFTEAERARIELLCDLCDDFDLPDGALAMVMGLIDRLHESHAQLTRLMAAVAEEQDEVRERLRARLR